MTHRTSGPTSEKVRTRRRGSTAAARRAPRGAITFEYILIATVVALAGIPAWQALNAAFSDAVERKASEVEQH